MKKIDILFNTSLKQVQGINYVNNSFVEGQGYFTANGIELHSIYSPDGVFHCCDHFKLDLIGSDVDTAEYKRTRKIRTFLRNLLPSEYLFGCLVKMFFNIYRPSKKALNYYLESNPDSDYLIFQDTWTAYFYYKMKCRPSKAKTILILHCGEDPIEQGIPMFYGFFKHKRLEKWYRKAVQFSMNSCDKVVYLSEKAAMSSCMSNERKDYVFNGIEDLKVYEFNGVHNPLNFVIVASVIEHKGQHVLIEAMNLIKEDTRKSIKLHIIGNGTNLNNCKELVTNYGLSDCVIFWGNRNDVGDVLKQMDVFILPSLSEGMPMSIIEAMRQGLYIVATPVGGIPEMIMSDFGEFVERDPRAIADCIANIIQRKKVTDESKKAARDYYLKNFTLKNMIDSYSKILNSL